MRLRERLRSRTRSRSVRGRFARGALLRPIWPAGLLGLDAASGAAGRLTAIGSSSSTRAADSRALPATQEEIAAAIWRLVLAADSSAVAAPLPLVLRRQVTGDLVAAPDEPDGDPHARRGYWSTATGQPFDRPTSDGPALTHAEAPTRALRMAQKAPPDPYAATLIPLVHLGLCLRDHKHVLW